MALIENYLAQQSELFIFCDGPKVEANKQDKDNIVEVKRIARSKNWCGTVHVIERESNLGLANNIMDGVTAIVNQFGKVIVLEDDILTSKGFLTYMNTALDLYENEDRVMHIAGFLPKLPITLPETLFYNVTTCWGWATWKRAWQQFNSNPKDLLEALLKKGYNEFDFNGGQKNLLYQQLTDNAAGNLKTWAVKWHTSVYLKDGFCLHPYKSLTENIGHDFSGENSGLDNPYQHVEMKDTIIVNKIPIEKNLKSYKYINKIYKEPILNRIIPKLVKEKIKTLLNSKKRKIYFEKRQLYKTPRFQPGHSNFLDSPFYFVDAATFLHGFEEIFEQEIYKFQCNHDKPNIIDCGSNIGLSVVYFKKLFPHAKIAAFEPDSNISKTLQKNIESFKLSYVEVNNKAIWVNNEGIEFQMEGGFSGRIPKPGDVENIVKVPTQRLKDLLHEKVDFLKMDIEGAEYEVLLDCASNLHNISNIFIEYHSHIKEKQCLHNILELLQNSGFRYHIHEAYSRKSPFVNKELMTGMDLQLNIYGIKESNI
jgi:FkbM family methyltransferase